MKQEMNMQKVMVAAAIAVMVVAAFTFLGMGESAAMAECQQRHSYDTCFRALNR